VAFLHSTQPLDALQDAFAARTCGAVVRGPTRIPLGIRHAPRSPTACGPRSIPTALPLIPCITDPATHDPRRAAMAAAVSSCVHCGFCLPACPTYKVLGEEMDSPRGRIVLMKEVLEGGLPLTDAAQHLDRCLGCLACETACPSGVRYRDLIEPMREDLVAHRPAAARLHLKTLLRVMASPALFRAAAALGTGAKMLAPALPASVGAMLGLLPPHLPAPDVAPAFTAARGRRRGRVALMTGCVQSVLRPSVANDAIRVLTAQGVEVVVPPGQGCCGALARHAGDHDYGTALAAAHAASFPADVDASSSLPPLRPSMKDTHTSGAPVLDVSSTWIGSAS
jgi:glycolate oxidase iron-sulfur subunit